MTAPRDIGTAAASVRSLARLVRSEVEEIERSNYKIQESARSVLSLRKADDVAFRAAVTVLVTDILGPGCWDSSNNETETKP